MTIDLIETLPGSGGELTLRVTGDPELLKAAATLIQEAVRNLQLKVKESGQPCQGCG